MSDKDKTNSAQVTADPATARVDVQDPLPETNWFWRRVYTFALSLIALAFIWYALEALNSLQDSDKIYRLARYMIGVLVLSQTYYMLAPSAEQMVKLIQSARLLREGVTIDRSASVEDRHGNRTEVSTRAGDHGPPPRYGGSGRRDDDDDYAPRSRV